MSMTAYERSKDRDVKEFRELNRTMGILGLENDMKRRILSIVQLIVIPRDGSPQD